ncbi:type II secretion system protein GspM [Sansalvadorimonas verongulae]|uniref:type II secretion system protein GspM n=1 Tax=Sansalvadorimonas verongulae TaxID=2172824 RepID=UPI0012BD48C2|nr:type II secretion system protein M [Sansalvadorimonas verongulae]MTI14336.1 type II secretion system protein M [Sansalvadorimonas verongulae]
MSVLTNKLTPVIDPVRERFQNMPQKDQRALMALSGFMVIVLFWFLVWKPLDDWADKEYAELTLERETQAFLAANYERTKVLIKSQNTGPKKDAAAAISSSGKRAGLNLTRVQPARQGVSVWLDAAPYQKLLGWLVQLHNREGLEVRQIRVERTDQTGMVKVFLRLAR